MMKPMRFGHVHYIDISSEKPTMPTAVSSSRCSLIQLEHDLYPMLLSSSATVSSKCSTLGSEISDMGLSQDLSSIPKRHRGPCPALFEAPALLFRSDLGAAR